MKRRFGRIHAGALILGVDLLLLCAIVAVFLVYSSGYRDKLREQNLSDISNLNRSSANIGGNFFRNQQLKVADVAQYLSLRAPGRDEALAFLSDLSSSGSSYFELVGTDCTGFAAVRTKDGFAPVDYTSADYRELRSLFLSSGGEPDGKIHCTREFTDGWTARKSFALYTNVRLSAGEGVFRDYALLAVSPSADFSGLIAVSGDYADMATVLVNRDGDYILGSREFKSGNLFRYFYDFNGLSLDRRNRLTEEFRSRDSGVYYYRDSRGRDCVFVFTKIPDTDWFCVSSVPLSSYHENPMDLRFTLWIAALLLALLAFNVLWLDKANRRLRDSVAKEKEASAAKTDFLSRMSHDIRTPLNVIIGTSILARRQNNPPATGKYLEDIDQSGKFLLSLVNDILDLNKVESGKMELRPAPCSLSGLSSRIGSIIRPLCRDKDIEFSVSGDDGVYLLDSVRAEQIFFNLLSNAVKFTPPGGHVGLRWRAEPGEAGGTLHFEVSDDGVGMSEEFQSRMFEAFSQERGSAASQGTGLGLAIVKNLTELMGGSVRAESAPGRGTVFFVDLPARPAESLPEEEESAAVSPDFLRGKNVLLFEDNDLNAGIAETLLTDAGMTVSRAADGREGLELFVASPFGRFDAVLMDLRMPVMDGLEATRALRSLSRRDARDIPIIAMTANAYDVDVQNCLEAGMNAHVAKPIDPELLFAVLAREISRAEKKRGRGKE